MYTTAELRARRRPVARTHGSNSGGVEWRVRLGPRHEADGGRAVAGGGDCYGCGAYVTVGLTCVHTYMVRTYIYGEGVYSCMCVCMYVPN